MGTVERGCRSREFRLGPHHIGVVLSPFKDRSSSVRSLRMMFVQHGIQLHLLPQRHLEAHTKSYASLR